MKPMKHTYAFVVAGVLAAVPAIHAQDKQTQQAVPRSAPAAPPPAAAPQTAPAPPPPSRAEAPPSRGFDRSAAAERAVPRSAAANRDADARSARPVTRSPASESGFAADNQGHPRTAQGGGHSGNGGSVRSGSPRSGTTSRGTGDTSSRASGGTTSRAVPRSQPADSGRSSGDPGVATAGPRSRGDRQSYGVATDRRFPPHHGGGHYPTDRGGGTPIRTASASLPGIRSGMARATPSTAGTMAPTTPTMAERVRLRQSSDTASTAH